VRGQRDPFDFVMETEGLGFKEALESLAQRYNVPIEAADEDPRRPSGGRISSGC